MSSIVTPSVVGWGRGSPTDRIACAADTALVLPATRTALSTPAPARVCMPARERTRTRRAKAPAVRDVASVRLTGCTRRCSPADAELVTVAVAASLIEASACRLAEVAVALIADNRTDRETAPTLAVWLAPSPDTRTARLSDAAADVSTLAAPVGHACRVSAASVPVLTEIGRASCRGTV